jgi:hypothetical protein
MAASLVKSKEDYTTIPKMVNPNLWTISSEYGSEPGFGTLVVSKSP